MGKLVRSIRASEAPDPCSDAELRREDIDLIEALAELDDVVDLALHVGEKKLDPKDAVAACLRKKREQREIFRLRADGRLVAHKSHPERRV